MQPQDHCARHQSSALWRRQREPWQSLIRVDERSKEIYAVSFVLLWLFTIDCGRLLHAADSSSCVARYSAPVIVRVATLDVLLRPRITMTIDMMMRAADNRTYA